MVRESFLFAEGLLSDAGKMVSTVAIGVVDLGQLAVSGLEIASDFLSGQESPQWMLEDWQGTIDNGLALGRLALGAVVAKLEDFINSVREDWDTSYGQLKEGIQIIESELASIDSSKNSEYTQGILNIFWGFRRLEVLIGDADELLVALHKKFMYKSGEITLEEYLDDGVIELEEVDDETEDL